MPLSDIDNMLSLVALAILADDHVHQVEIDVFAMMAQKLPVLNLGHKKMNEIDLRSWYQAHQIRLFKFKNSPDYDNLLSEAINRVRHVEDRRAILLAMLSIAKSDQIFHSHEKNLILHLSERWNIELPLGKIANPAI